jgi:hypothetical protein
MSKTIVGRELNAQIDRLVTEKRQLMRKFKALEATSCEKESEAEAFYTLIAARFGKAATEEENETAKKVFAGRTITAEAEKAAAEEVNLEVEPEPTPAQPAGPTEDGEGD